MKRIGILGAGTWGMALARMLTVSGNDVLVWSAIEKEIDSLSTTRKHPNLPQMKIPDELRFTKSIEEVCKDKDILLFAVPSVFVRSTAAKARPYVADGQIIVDVAKGIEPDTLYTMTEILADELGKEGGPKGVRLVALSGPTHAEEVAIDLPTTIVSASKDMDAAAYVQEVFTNNVMRVYTNEDIKGVELSGAMKNVIALGVGISTGLGYGDEQSGILFLLAVGSRKYVTITYGEGVTAFTDYRIEQQEDEIVPQLSDEEWADAAYTYIDMCDDALDYYADYGEPIDVDNDIGLEDLLIAMIFPLGISAFICFILYRRMKTARKKTEADEYMPGFTLRVKRDRYTHTTRERTYDPPQKESNSSGGSSVDSDGFGGSSGGSF